MNVSNISARSQGYLFCGTIIALFTIVLLPALRTNVAFVLPQLLLVTTISIAPHILRTHLWTPTLRNLLSFSLGAAIPLWIVLAVSAEVWTIGAVATIGTVIAAAFALWQLYSTYPASTFQKLAPVVLHRPRQLHLMLTAIPRVAFNFFKTILLIKG